MERVRRDRAFDSWRTHRLDNAARIILEFGEGRAFDRFDRFAQERESQGKTLGQLLDEFAQLRTRNLEDLRGCVWAKRS